MARKSNVDGFIPRRSPRAVGGDYVSRRSPSPMAQGLRQRPIISDTRSATSVGSEGLTRSDIDESLNEIDTQAPLTRKERKQQKKHQKAPKSRRRKVIKRVIIALVIILLAIGGYVAFKAMSASNSVFKGDIFGLVQQKKLQQDANGRTNILILGTSEDDPGHQGAYLTDSIMVLSLDQANKNAYMISIPRDMQVQYGMACDAGYAGKINVYFNCVNSDWGSESAETERQAKSREFYGNILGIPIQYSAHVNYSVMRDVVNAVGNITVNIQGSGGAPGVMDSNFDWKCKGGNAHASLATMKQNCPPSGHFIDYPNGPATLDAEHALYLAQARGDVAPTYGLGNSNFDREQNQQKIVLAIKEKATGTGTLTNIGKITGLIDAIGKNLRTNFETSEVRTLMTLAKDIPSSSFQSVNLLDGGIMTGDAQPVAGLYNFTQLQAFVKKMIYATGITKEGAHVIVLNASGVAGAAQTEADKLTALGMTVDTVDNAPTGGAYVSNEIFKLTDSKMPLTTAKLESLYGAKIQQV
ncbi:MAG TPA: LCP family protein, partial [Candidatus Saccharimonadales bacterium]|nr:LCP family protein [Candidatus Saccharimonadales bacterium]